MLPPQPLLLLRLLKKMDTILPILENTMWVVTARIKQCLKIRALISILEDIRKVTNPPAFPKRLMIPGNSQDLGRETSTALPNPTRKHMSNSMESPRVRLENPNMFVMPWPMQWKKLWIRWLPKINLSIYNSMPMQFMDPYSPDRTSKKPHKNAWMQRILEGLI